MLDKCPICKFTVTPFAFDLSKGRAHIHCTVCGVFDVSERFLTIHFGHLIQDTHIYSGAIREHNLSGNTYILNDLEDLRRSVWIPENPIRQIDKLLMAIDKTQKFFGENLTYNCELDYPFAYAKNADEYYEFLRNAHYLEYIEFSSGGSPQGSIKLKLKGAERIAELHKSDVNSNQAFIAMWFHSRTKEVLENGIEPALVETHFKPLRIDQKEFDSKIDDEIIASIRKSGLVIADVTGHRQNVYFEAGYAMGLGIQVIWTCCDKFIRNAHFDTRQYNHILWTDAEDLKKKLINRIEATRPTRIS